MDITQLYRDYNVPFVTENHRHARPGWVNTVCPFCTGNPGYHLGFSIDSNGFTCYRCGGHFPVLVISKLLNISKGEAFNVLKQYELFSGKAPEKKIKVRIKSFKFPKGTTDLMPNHKRYLESRCFDVNYLIKTFHIKGTGVFAKLDNLNYKHRIIIPFKWYDKIISFNSRDITGKAKNKYMACPENRELITHKKILYGVNIGSKDVGICVEGSTDVWRMGVNSFAVSGIKYTHNQVRLISRLYKRVAVMFDDDPQAVVQANKLIADLKFRGVDAFRVDIERDPGALSQSEADYIVKQII